MSERILIVDDEEKIRFVLTCLLEEAGYEIRAAADGVEAVAVVSDWPPDLVMLDLQMPTMDGMETLSSLREGGFQGQVIVLTAYGTIPSAVEAMRLGAHDYITKPFVNDELLMVIERALRHNRLERELDEARVRLDGRFAVSSIITNNPQMILLLETVKRIAPTDTAVLITGESGTGKELFANAIHQNSRRKNRPFLALNCGALPATLVESELFGHRKGAFSGAGGDKKGLVEQADGGTLFLDEVGEMGADAQVKLLRFAQSGEFIAVGGTGVRRVDVRLLAASNRNLEAALEDGSFRRDLYYRLNVVAIDIPPLRQRPEDIPLLADHFVRKHSGKAGKGGFRFGAEAMEALQRHTWPGNVRELENAVNSALVMATSSPIGAESLPLSIRSGVGAAPVEQEKGIPIGKVVASQQEALERGAIIRALRQCGGNQTRAAKSLGIGRNTLWRKMKRYGIGH